MLQITIVHSKNSLKVLEIKSVNTLEILSSFDSKTNKIDLEPLKNHIGELAMISHYNETKNGIEFDYENPYTITKVEQDNDGVWYFEYE